MRFLLLFLLLGGPYAPWKAAAQLPAIQAVINAVRVDSMAWRLERLSGELPVDVGNGAQLIASRNKYQPGNAVAAEWLHQEFSRMGFFPVAQGFGGTGANIIAMKAGLVHPERKVIICGHYDSMPGGPIAPGADDNGSGACAVLEAARAMAGHAFENTVVFALWDEEEQGLTGSAYYASAAAGNDEEILAVVNMDAIGYDGNGDGLMRIHARPVANSIAIKDSALMVNSTYGLNFPIAINNPGETYSDHASFWSEGYGAILAIEDFDDDPNPHYHSPNDRMEYMDLDYWGGAAKLAIGTVAAMAVPYDGNSRIGEVDRSAGPTMELFPHPEQGSMEVRFSIGTSSPVILTLMDAMGRPVRELRSGASGAEARTVQVDLRELPPGAYLISVSDGRSALTRHFVRMP